MPATSFQLVSACLPLHRPAAFEYNILDGIRDLLLVLGPDFRVLHASRMCFEFTTFTPESLVGSHITTFMHYDDLPVFLNEYNANMLANIPWRFHHRLRKADDTFAVFESTINPFIDTTAVQTGQFFEFRKCVMTVRPYSKPSVVLLDSYLDQMTTEARLVKQLNQLRSESQSPGEDKEEVVDEHVMEEIDLCAPSTAKTKKKVSSICVLIYILD